MILLQLSAWQIGLLFLPALINLWAIYHAYIHQFPTPQERLLWLGAGVALPIIGGILYAIIGMRRASK